VNTKILKKFTSSSSIPVVRAGWDEQNRNKKKRNIFREKCMVRERSKEPIIKIEQRRIQSEMLKRREEKTENRMERVKDMPIRERENREFRGTRRNNIKLTFKAFFPIH
jgi:hypothetical protein